MKKFILLTLLALAQRHALASPLVSLRQDLVVRTLRCDFGTASIQADTAKCTAEGVFCKESIGVVITAGTAAAYTCLQQCSCV
ncbi:hypothetical protein QC762_109189 [Podospora pseudocomata]|uniref:Uncharacterized protein n=1 Tax=Podospora pseudocomata TaxID=2093779 RepID=A0ABR0GU85_9PEZI|nr:hypothetical protein QC762_109189 [Podospora pseudocomata]